MNFYTIFLLVLVLYVGSKLSEWIGNLIVYFQNRSVLKAITPTGIIPERLCKGPHMWLNVTAWTEKGNQESKVCRICGLIDGTNKMATEAGIDRIEENSRAQAIEEKIYQDFIEKENGELRAFFSVELKQGISFDKLAMIHNAGITFGTRFNKYKVSRLPEMLKELEKSDA